MDDAEPEDCDDSRTTKVHWLSEIDQDWEGASLLQHCWGQAPPAANTQHWGKALLAANTERWGDETHPSIQGLNHHSAAKTFCDHP